MSQVVAPFAWYGGKSRLAPAIVDLLPRHDTYVEPFGGAGAVLVAKARSTLEVYNDIDSGLVTFFRVLRDRPAELERALRLTPYAREEFREACATWEYVQDDLERARRWYVRCRQAFAASAATVGWAFEVDGAQRGGTRSGSFATSVEHLERFAERFRSVQVDQLDWRECIRRYDRGGGLFLPGSPVPPSDPRARTPFDLPARAVGRGSRRSCRRGDSHHRLGPGLRVRPRRLRGPGRGWVRASRVLAPLHRVAHSDRPRAPHRDRLAPPRARHRTPTPTVCHGGG